VATARLLTGPLLFPQAARLATLGRPVEASTSAGVLTGVAESVDEDGALLLYTPDGRLHRLLAGDVTLAHP